MLTPKNIEKNLDVIKPYFIPSLARTNENSPIWLKRITIVIDTLVGSFNTIPVINVAVTLIIKIITVNIRIIHMLYKNKCKLTIRPILIKNKLMNTSWNGCT